MNADPVRRWAAEFAGTALLVGIGTGTIVATGRADGVPVGLLAIAWFVAVLVPILAFVRVSGAHLNPAVTLALAASGRVAWRVAPAYWVAQGLGALFASGVVRATLGGGDRLGATVPSGSLAWAFVAEAGFSALLVAAVFLLADRGEGRRRWRLALPPAVVGLSTYVIGPITGSSLNPARTLGPAVWAGVFTDIWLYFAAVPLAALAVAVAWKPRSVDAADRGPGRAFVPGREPAP